MTILVTPSLMRNLKIFTSTLTAIPLMLTVYRVICRYAMRRFWWEDACAVVALIGSVIYVVTSWPHFEMAGQSSVISFWIHALSYPSVVWSVRLSVLFSILRIMSPLRKLRRAMILMAGLFVLMWFSLTITFIARYASDHHWNTTQSPSDSKGRKLVAIFELINILSDATLIILPIHSLRFVKLPRSQRRLIITAFSTSILVTIISAFRAVCQLFNIQPLISVAIDVEVACSLFVCNSLLITILVYRTLHRSSAANDANMDVPSSHSPDTPKSTLQLSTVIQDAFGSITSGSVATDRPATACPGDGREKRRQDTLAPSQLESLNNE